MIVLKLLQEIVHQEGKKKKKIANKNLLLLLSVATYLKFSAELLQV